MRSGKTEVTGPNLHVIFERSFTQFTCTRSGNGPEFENIIFSPVLLIATADRQNLSAVRIITILLVSNKNCEL